MQKSKSVRIITTSAVLLIFAIYFLLNTEKFRPLLDANYYLLSIAALGYVGGILANGVFIKFILEPFKKYIDAREAFYVSVISSVGNFFAPAGTGFGIRAIYLKKKHGLAYSEFVSTLSGNYVLMFLVNSIVGISSLVALRQLHGVQWVALLIVFLTMFIGSLTVSILRFKIPEPEVIKTQYRSKIKRNIYLVIMGWSKIATNKKLMVKLLGLTCLNLAFTLVIYWSIIHSLNLSIKPAALLLFSVLGALSIFINITPANLGIKEAIYIFSATVLGFSISQIVLIALIDRGVQFAVLLVLWLIASRAHTRDNLVIQKN